LKDAGKSLLMKTIEKYIMFRFRDINKINKDAGFIAYRERNLFWLLKLLTIGGCGLMGIWFIPDLILCRDILVQLIILRISVAAAFLLNYFIAIYITKKFSKFHLYVGFYLGMLACAFLSVATSSIDYLYWFGLIFLIVAWHILVPFSYRKLTIHGLIFIVIFNFIMLIFCFGMMHFRPMLQINMIFLVVNFISAIVAISRNESDMNDYNNSNIIEKQLADLHGANEQMKEEIELRKKSENKLMKYSLVIDQTPSGVIFTDKNGIIEYANPRVCAITCFISSELVGKPLQIIESTPESSPEFNEMMHTIQFGETWQGELECKRNNEPFWVSAFTSPYKNRKGDIQGFICDLYDITIQKKMQEALKVSEEKYRLLVNEARDGIVITQEGKFQFANKAICEILGYAEKELIGKLFSDVIVPEDHQKLAEYHARRMKGEKYSILYTTTVIHKTGYLIYLELHAKTIDYNGKPAAFIMARDVSQRIKAEEELKNARIQLELANKQLEEMVSNQTQALAKASTQLLELQNKNLQTQFEILKSQVNPHFLFNSLNVLTSLIKLEPDLAEQFTEQLAKVYRYILENKDKDLVLVQTEIDFLQAYVFLLDIRFKDKLFVDFSVEEEALHMYVVPLALQLILENCIKHNTFSRKSPLRIKIYSDKCCYVTVSNNLQKRESHFASTGVGLKNIESRYALLCDHKTEFTQTKTEFIARIPLLETV